jgi:acetyltransferase-like isoleucine patch superfamily enzyme
MVRFGNDWGYRSQGSTRLRIDGTLIFKGTANFIKSAQISVFENARLTFGADSLVSENVIIVCQYKITFGKCLRLTYQSNVFDSDFHYSINLEHNTIAPKVAEINIGDYNWIGNRTTIKKGVKTPAYTIVAASYSLLTKDYTKIIPEYSIIGGMPAKLMKTGFARTWKDEYDQIKRYDAFYEKNGYDSLYQVPRGVDVKSLINCD